MQIISLFLLMLGQSRGLMLGVFSDSTLKKALTTNSLDLPEASALPGISTKISHHVVGDDAFPLNMRLTKPFPLSQFGHRATYI